MQKKAIDSQNQSQILNDFSIILTDPLLGNSDYLDDLLMKPFHNYN